MDEAVILLRFGGQVKSRVELRGDNAPGFTAINTIGDCLWQPLSQASQ